LTCVAWRVFFTARHLKPNPETGEFAMGRLAVGSLPPGSSSSGTQKYAKTYVLPGGYELLGRLFQKNF